VRHYLLALAMLYVGCLESSGIGEAESNVADPVDTSDAAYCVSVINRYRAKAGAPPLERSVALEAFAMKGAESDGKSGRPHGYFSQTSGGGIAWAENEIPGWPGSVRDVIAEGTEMMWNEGPGGGHHDNIANRKWKEVGCGIYVTAGKKVWVTQDFR
jgi:uncharacterized protein YkwD